MSLVLQRVHLKGQGGKDGGRERGGGGRKGEEGEGEREEGEEGERRGARELERARGEMEGERAGKREVEQNHEQCKKGLWWHGTTDLCTTSC